MGRNELLWMIEDVCACITITFLGVDGWNMMEPCRVCHGLPWFANLFVHDSFLRTQHANVCI